MFRKTIMMSAYGAKVVDVLLICDEVGAEYRVGKNDSGTKYVQITYANEAQKQEIDKRVSRLMNGRPESGVYYNNIRDLRTAAGFTQQGFGDYFGVPRRTVQSWELGERECTDYCFKLIEYKLRKEGYIK